MESATCTTAYLENCSATLARARSSSGRTSESTLEADSTATSVDASCITYLCKHHTPFSLQRSDCAFIRKLDAQGDKSIFGSGFIISKRAAAELAAAELAAAERAAAERAAVTVWTLSPREREIQRMLSHRGECLTK